MSDNGRSPYENGNGRGAAAWLVGAVLFGSAALAVALVVWLNR